MTTPANSYKDWTDEGGHVISSRQFSCCKHHILSAVAGAALLTWMPPAGLHTFASVTRSGCPWYLPARSR